MASLTAFQSSSANSGHSVTRMQASAPATASSALEANLTPGISARASCSATGSYAETVAPSACSRAASTSDDASRMSSVFALKASPSSAT